MFDGVRTVFDECAYLLRIGFDAKVYNTLAFMKIYVYLCGVHLRFLYMGFEGDYVQQKIRLMKANGERADVVAAIATLYASGSRIGAVLALKRQQLTTGGLVVIHQGKGSAPIVCTAPPELKAWAAVPVDPSFIFPYTNYTAVYRMIRRYRLEQPNGFGVNTAVTAQARKERAQDIYAATLEITDVAAALGHRNTRSSTYYLDDWQLSEEQRRREQEARSRDLGPIVVTRRGVIRSKKRKSK